MKIKNQAKKSKFVGVLIAILALVLVFIIGHYFISKNPSVVGNQVNSDTQNNNYNPYKQDLSVINKCANALKANYTKPYVPGDLLVFFKNTTTEDQAKSFIESYNMSWHSITWQIKLEFLNVKTGTEFQWICALRDDPLVARITLNTPRK